MAWMTFKRSSSRMFNVTSVAGHMADSEISQRTDQHASVQKHDISIWLEHDIYMKPLQIKRRSIMLCKVGRTKCGPVFLSVGSSNFLFLLCKRMFLTRTTRVHC
jgi:hypothetical protein